MTNNYHSIERKSNKRVKLFRWIDWRTKAIRKNENRQPETDNRELLGLERREMVVLLQPLVFSLITWAVTKE